MSNDAEDRGPALDLSQVRTDPRIEPDSPVLTTEHLSEFAEWLEARLDALDNRFHRFDKISTRNTRQVTEDMAELRSTVSHLHERAGQLIAGNHRTLQDLLQAEIRVALEEDRKHLARVARRRMLWTLAVLLITAAGLVAAALVWLEIWTPPWG